MCIRDRDGLGRCSAGADRPGAATQELAVDRDLRPGGPGHAAGARRAVAGRCEMTALSRHVQQYLALRRSFGFKLEREEQLLAQFVAYSEAADQEHLTSDLAIAWAKLPVAASPNLSLIHISEPT